jgi:hypothetical protein
MQLALMDEGDAGTEQAQLTAINTAVTVINNGSSPGLGGKRRPLQRS